jgi:hypothetical protein
VLDNEPLQSTQIEQAELQGGSSAARTGSAG